MKDLRILSKKKKINKRRLTKHNTHNKVKWDPISMKGINPKSIDSVTNLTYKNVRSLKLVVTVSVRSVKFVKSSC